MQDQSLSQKIMADETAFLNYWQETEIIREFETDQLEGALDQPVRKAIINILSEGRMIEDKDGKDRRIRVMNASQLLDRINQIAEEQNKYNLDPIKRSNLYYHINALVDKGFIREVGLIPKKNRLIAYYGRTARVFLLKYDKGDHKPEILKDEDLPNLIKEINTELDNNQVDKIINGLEMMYKEVDTTPIHNWISSNEKALRASDIDIRHLHGIFYKILRFDDETISAMREFAKAMKLNIDNIE